MGSECRVEVEVTKLWGEENSISTAVVHPTTAAEGCEVQIPFSYLKVL